MQSSDDLVKERENLSEELEALRDAIRSDWETMSVTVARQRQERYEEIENRMRSIDRTLGRRRGRS